MCYEEFMQNLLEKMEGVLGKEVEVFITQVQKNNQAMKEVLTFEEAGINMMPVIYLDGLYERYKESDLAGCINFIFEILETRRYIAVEEIFRDWDQAKKKIQLQLIRISVAM